jgi:integrase/recombinase XerD
MSEDTITKNNYFFNYYLKSLPRRYRKTPLISVDCLRHVLGNIDPKKFSLKDNIYKSIRSFTKYLMLNSHCESSLFDELKQLRPKRFYPPKKVHCTQEQFEKLLSEASIRVNGQSNYHVILNTATIATIVFSGLRASELCNLRLQDVDLVNKKLFVYLGKGKKNRSIGICNRLYDYLIKYLEVRPKSDNNNLFLTISNLSGEPVSLTRETLLQKVKRLSKRIGLDINLHGLRRTFATVAANAGKPINIISLALGHSDLKTTQGYLMTSQDEVIKEMQGW